MLQTRIHLQGSSNSFDSDIATIRVSLLDEVQFSLVCRPRVSWPFTFFPFICTCNTAEKNIMKNRAKLVLWPIISYCEACLQLFQFAFCLLWCACDTLWSGPTLIVFTMNALHQMLVTVSFLLDFHDCANVLWRSPFNPCVRNHHGHDDSL